jgi:hypothetical protein
VAAQRLHRLGRAVFVQVLAAGAGHLFEQRHAPPHHAGLGQLAHAQHAVNALAHQVHQPVAHADLEFDVRVALKKIANHRQQKMFGQRAVQIHAQLAARLAARVDKGRLGLFQVRQQAQAALVIRRAVLRGAHVPRRAVQQPRAQALFKLLHRVRHRGARQAQVVGRLRKTAQLDDAREQLHRTKTVHLLHDLIVGVN